MFQTKVISFALIILASLLVFGAIGVLNPILDKPYRGTGVLDIMPEPFLFFKIFLCLGLVHGLAMVIVVIFRGTETAASLFLSALIGNSITAVFSAVFFILFIKFADSHPPIFKIAPISIKDFGLGLLIIFLYFIIFSLILLIPSIITTFINIISLKYVAKADLGLL